MSDKTGWQMDEAAQHWRRTADISVPGRSDVLQLMTDCVIAFAPGKPAFLDLGSGLGDVTGSILKKASAASADLIDFSDEMVRLSGERFLGNDKIKIYQSDLNRGLPAGIQENAYDAVVSCFALHHLDFERRVPLYNQIRKVLKPGGVFINSDRFIEESELVNEWIFDSWMKWISEQARARAGIERTVEQVKKRQLESDKRLGDKPGTLWDMAKDLRAAGFKNIDCVYKSHIIATIIAIK